MVREKRGRSKHVRGQEKLEDEEDRASVQMTEAEKINSAWIRDDCLKTF